MKMCTRHLGECTVTRRLHRVTVTVCHHFWSTVRRIDRPRAPAAPDTGSWSCSIQTQLGQASRRPPGRRHGRGVDGGAPVTGLPGDGAPGDGAPGDGAPGDGAPR
ncbi:hypothetical protein GB931_16120 [Modestobacter sp. I12A-02628]|nr:hypothetical protein [Goekera deserti]NDI48903.1 hypothetical protein [Goekera deserti]